MRSAASAHLGLVMEEKLSVADVQPSVEPSAQDLQQREELLPALACADALDHLAAGQIQRG